MSQYYIEIVSWSLFLRPAQLTFISSKPIIETLECVKYLQI